MSRLRLWTVAVLVVFAASPTATHHSVIAEFDGSKPVALQGALAKIRWESPHVWVYVDVKDAGGKIVNWGVECAPPSRIPNAVRELLRVGDAVTINAYRARDASRADAHAYDIVLADGRRFIIGLRLS